MVQLSHPYPPRTGLCPPFRERFFGLGAALCAPFFPGVSVPTTPLNLSPFDLFAAGLQTPAPEFIVDVESMDIFPVGWCEANSYPLTTPHKTACKYRPHLEPKRITAAIGANK